jgi:DNA-binding LytR/AlgR family response regulator
VQIEIKIDSECREPRMVLVTDHMTEELNDLVRRLSGQTPQMLAGFREDTLEILNPAEVLRIYAASGKVYAVTERGEYALRQRLYELEERLAGGRFVRSSNSEILNLGKVRSFDLSFAGTICVTLADGSHGLCLPPLCAENQTGAWNLRRNA